jgi:hypothetical protein
MPTSPTMKAPNTARIDATQYRPAKMYALDLNTTDVALFTGNTAVKVQIVLALAEQELEGWKMFRLMADGKFKDWQDQIQRLESLRDMLQEKKKEGTEIVGKAREMHNRVMRLEEETEAVRHYSFAN